LVSFLFFGLFKFPPFLIVLGLLHPSATGRVPLDRIPVSPTCPHPKTPLARAQPSYAVFLQLGLFPLLTEPAPETMFARFGFALHRTKYPHSLLPPFFLAFTSTPLEVRFQRTIPRNFSPAQVVPQPRQPIPLISALFGMSTTTIFCCFVWCIGYPPVRPGLY